MYTIKSKNTIETNTMKKRKEKNRNSLKADGNKM